MAESDLAAAIRRHMTAVPPAQSARQSYEAVLAVVEKCEQLSAEFRPNAAEIAAEFERVIAEALGINQ